MPHRRGLIINHRLYAGVTGRRQLHARVPTIFGPKHEAVHLVFAA